MKAWRDSQDAKKNEASGNYASRKRGKYWTEQGPEKLDQHIARLQEAQALREQMAGGGFSSTSTSTGQSEQRQPAPGALRKRQQRQREREAKAAGETKAKQTSRRRGVRGGAKEQPSPNPFAGTHADPAQALRRATKRVKDRCSKLPTSHPSLHYSTPSFCLSL